MVVSSLGSFATYRAVTTRGPAERRRSLCSATKPRRDRMASIVERGGNSTSGYVSLKRSSSFLDPHPHRLRTSSASTFNDVETINLELSGKHQPGTYRGLHRRCAAVQDRTSERLR